MDSRYAYLTHLLAWSLPILVAQFVTLWWVHRENFGRVLKALLPPALIVSAWLIAADHLAISAGIWRFGEGKHLGVKLLSVPIEEVLFFIITNLLVAFGLALFGTIGWKRVPA